MRFLANGPNIPDLLLERRDQGRVVFLCGAEDCQRPGPDSFDHDAELVQGMIAETARIAVNDQ